MGYSQLLGTACQKAVLAQGSTSTTTVCKIPTEKQVRLLLFIKFESLGRSRIHGFCEGNSIKLPDTCQDELLVMLGLPTAEQTKVNPGALL